MKKRLGIFMLTVVLIFSLIYYLFNGVYKQNNANNKQCTITPIDTSKEAQLNENTDLSSTSSVEKFTLKSKAFSSGNVISVKYVCNELPGGGNISIPLEWSGVPLSTKSFAIFMYDLHPVAKNFVHWAVINIPNSIGELKEGASTTLNMPEGSIELTNSSGKRGYTGPCPPSGTGKHEYKIVAYALNTKDLNLSGITSLNKFMSAINGKVLAESEISGYFGW